MRSAIDEPTTSTRPTTFSAPASIPWTTGSFSNSSYVEFTAPYPATIPPCPLDSRTTNQHKRKSEIINPIPPKQIITEEKMSSHFDNLHISTEYVNHKHPLVLESRNDVITMSSGHNEQLDANNSSVTTRLSYQGITFKDLEDKLKRANTLTICEEIKKMKSHDNILPRALLAHYEKPCTALVVWQAPKPLEDMILKKIKNRDNKSKDDNNTMDTDS